MLDKFRFFKDKGDKKSGVAKTSSSKKTSSTSSEKDVDKSQLAAGGSAAPQDGKGGVGPGSRVGQPPPQNADQGASGGSSPKVAVKSFAKKTLGLKKKDTATSKDDLNSKRGISTSTSLQGKSLAVNGSSTASSSGAKKSSTSGKAEKADASSASATRGSSGSTGQGSPGTAKKTSKIASLAGKSSSKTSKNAASTSNLSSVSSGTGIPTPATGIPKPGSRAAKLSKEDTKSKLQSSGKEQAKSAPSAPAAVANKMSTQNLSPQVRPESPKPTARLSPQPPADHDRNGTRPGKVSSSNQVQVDDLVQVNKNAKAAAMAAASKGSVPQQASPSGKQEAPALSSTHSSKAAKSAAALLAQPQSKILSERDQKKKVKPLKVDSDTQTHASAVAVVHARMRDINKEQSSLSLSSEGSANVSSGENSKSSTSNSNNSVSSNDSVIFRPSSCDELESGVDSDTNVKATDHISSLRQSHGSSSPISQRKDSSSSSQKSSASKKMETTFDTEVRTETRDVKHTHSKETTFGDEQEEVIDIKPMQPIMRPTPYAYLRSITAGPLPRPSFHMSNNLSSQNTNSASSRLGVNRPLIDPQHIYSKSMKRTISNGHSVLESDYSSDVEFDVTGYMSDGDVLRTTSSNAAEDPNNGYMSDVNSGYMSEGGASLYAKRMQQRFREGMAAVKECMQKSTGIADEDR